jgi:hypothetical protein
MILGSKPSMGEMSHEGITFQNENFNSKKRQGMLVLPIQSFEENLLIRSWFDRVFSFL